MELLYAGAEPGQAGNSPKSRVGDSEPQPAWQKLILLKLAADTQHLYDLAPVWLCKSRGSSWRCWQQCLAQGSRALLGTLVAVFGVSGLGSAW